MKNVIVAVLLLILVTACSKQQESSVNYSATDASIAESSASAAPEAASEPMQDPRRFMAYSHMVALEASEDQVEKIHNTIKSACMDAIAEQCVILNSNVNVGREVSAEIFLRAKSAGIKRIITKLRTQGKIINQSVSAEDLAAPIGDSERRLKMLQDYRTQLEALRSKAAGDIESLIKVNKELSETQVQIEALSGEKAHLMHRVETETLRISIATKNKSSFWRPIGSALEAFKANFGQGISAVITTLAYIIPWALLLLALWFVFRKIRARKK